MIATISRSYLKSGLSFHRESDGETFESLESLKADDAPVIIKVDGHIFRDVPGPTTLPVVGNYLEGT